MAYGAPLVHRHTNSDVLALTQIEAFDFAHSGMIPEGSNGCLHLSTTVAVWSARGAPWRDDQIPHLLPERSHGAHRRGGPDRLRRSPRCDRGGEGCRRLRIRRWDRG